MSSRIKTACPSCSKEFDVSSEHLGKRAFCVFCKTKFEVAPIVKAFDPEEFFDSQKVPVTTAVTEVPKPQTPPEVNWGESPTKAVAIKQKSKSTGDTSKIWVPLAVGFCCLLVGFFAGREQLKYQLRTTLQQAFKQAINPSSLESVAQAKKLVPPAAGNPVMPSPEPSPLQIGTPVEQATFSIALTKATLGKVSLKGLRSTNDSSEDYLSLFFSITNKDERKQHSLQGDGNFGASRFQVVDDVANVVRAVDFGFSLKVVGAVEGFADIAPLQTIQHIAVFSVPLPKTEHLILKIDLQCIGGEGIAKYIIPMDAISKN
jgi:hypothetical protein